MKVTKIEPLVCQGGIRNWTFVKISTDEDIVGWGDATEWVRVQSHLKAMEDLSRFVVGEDPFDVEKIWQRMWVASYMGGKDVCVAMTGIETALWDIIGKALGVPVYKILGGKCYETIRLYADYADEYGSGYSGGTEWIDGDSSLEGIAKQAKLIKKQKFTALKCHAIGLPERPSISRTASLQAINDTAEKIKTIREAVGNSVDICVDINNRLDLPSSMALAKALEPYNLLDLEDPIRQDESPLSYKRLAESTSTPIGTGENLYNIWEFRNYLEVNGLDVLLPDVCHVGVLQSKKIGALGEAYHLPICPHNPNSPLSTVISAEVCATLPNFLALEFYMDERDVPWRDKVISPSFKVKDGYLELPTGPGWGVEVNEDEVAKHPYDESWYTWLTGKTKRDRVYQLKKKSRNRGE
jgi:galactonate dehydratase